MRSDVFTRAGLEQASSERMARHHVRYTPFDRTPICARESVAT
jgi:hypothetical protein